MTPYQTLCRGEALYLFPCPLAVSITYNQVHDMYTNIDVLCSLPLPSQLCVAAVVPQPATRLGTPQSSHILLPNCMLHLKTVRANSTMPRASSRRCRFPCLRFRHLLRQHQHLAQHYHWFPSFFVALARSASQSVLRVPKIVYPVLRATTSRRQNRIILDLY